MSLIGTVPIDVLARIIDPYPLHERSFRCPQCGGRADANDDGETWSCGYGSTRHHGTRWGLERIIIENPELLRRLADWLSAA